MIYMENIANTDSDYEYQMIPEPEDYQLSEKQYQAKLEQWAKGNPGIRRQKHDDEWYVNKLLEVLNMDPPEKFIKKLTVGKEKDKSGKWIDKEIKYIPIDKVVFLLRRTFGLYWKHEIRSSGVMLNSASMVVRLHYKVPNTNIWMWQDGSGAKQFNLNKDSMASDLTQIQSNAVMLAYPSSESYALSRAAEWLGKLFGGGLDRPDYRDFTGAWNPDDYDDNQNDNNDTKNNQNNNQSFESEELIY